MNEMSFALGTLATEFGVSRDVLRRIVSEASVAPTGKRRGHPVYRLRDVYRAILAQTSPEGMNPHARLALAKAQLAEDELRVRRGQLVEADDCADQFALLVKTFVRHVEALPDNLERNCGLPRPALERVERVIDELRDELYREVTNGDHDD